MSFKMNKLTPVLFVEEIEPCLPFWVDRLGFAKTTEVPEGAKLGFVILAKEGVEVMYQTYASADKDVPGLVKRNPPATYLYVQVSGLSEIIARLAGAPIVLQERTAFYGAREIGVREPGGNLVTFSEFGTGQ
jgi:uncharacterized glyoxalase superfamily protein PhnB